MNNNPIYACLSLKDFSITLFTTKSMAADYMGVHRNTLQGINTRTTYGDYVYFPVELTKCKKGMASR